MSFLTSFQVKEYIQLISIYEKKLSNLTVRVEIMEKDTISYTELDFELIKLEVKEMEKLIIKLKSSFVGSSEIVDQLEVEVRGELTSQCIDNKCLQLSVLGQQIYESLSSDF